MPTLLEALSSGSYDTDHKKDTSTDFAKKLIKLRKEIIDDYYKYNISLNTLISKIVKRESLNDDQIKRVVEDVNNQVYLIEYAKLKNKNDRTVKFDIALFEKIKGEEKKEDYKENEDGKEKTAMEKVAGTSEKANIFNGTSYKFGGITLEGAMSVEDYTRHAITGFMQGKRDSIEKTAATLEKTAAILGDTLIQLKKFGSDPTEVLSAIAKHASLNDNEISLIKESAESRVGIAKMKRMVNDAFELGIGDVELTKTASESFGLGKYSRINSGIQCETSIPKLMIQDNISIASIDDIAKIASAFKEQSDALGKEYVIYKDMLDKCAAAGVTDF